MGFPDRIERTVEIAHPPGQVWTALTTAEGLGTWFGDEATIDLCPGGAGRMSWTDGHTAGLRVERVEEPTVFGFTWQIYGLPEDDPRRTYVEFTLEPTGAGTRLKVVETGFSQLPDDTYRKEYDAHIEGWANELGELADYLDAAA
ncbi:SRPBCC domain-containing protein [Amycolatopsis sp. H20-H5]|uniref:SRPBCC domain-containing protein n=1 Tax=Amycolatopsis sp. H20-H5 TaxID=3046309 RepID=UPI002DBE966F|nr:SRPBCC domain-containing protein [Amycolatopsis sp. H20-H5]MEC3974806.1 SRPBCC domain-containing protein [Amycolatopsis sp. H20-H5]